MLITNEPERLNFRNAFQDNLYGSNNIKIASGYIGASEIAEYRDQLCDISRAGGVVQIIHGMGGAEGLSKNLYDKLVELDTELKDANANNRVFVHRTHYHGKMYITGNDDASRVLVGSSNFSSSGFGRNLELNYCHTEPEVCNHANQLFDRLKANSFYIDKIKLPDRNKVKRPPSRAQGFDPNVFNAAPDKSIEIRVTDASNLNLFLSKGRLNRNTMVYTPRPYEEVELTIGAGDLEGIRRFLPDQTAPAEFRAVTDLGTTFMVKFKRKTMSRADNRMLHETGIDFMSTGRAEGGRKQLGEYMKGKLMDKGLLSFGEPVTEDVLIEYGKSHLDMYFVGEGFLYLKF